MKKWVANKMGFKDIETSYNTYLLQNKPELTIFMLTYNREKLLSIAINSILQQTYKNFFFLILDNCSTDNTSLVVESYKDLRLNYLYRKSESLCPNTQFALNFCKTKYFIILHDDDVYSPTYLDDITNIMNKSDYAALSVAPYYINQDGKITSNFKYTNNIKSYNDYEYLNNYLNKSFTTLIYPSVIYKTELFKEFPNFAGNPDVGPAGDQYIWLQTCRNGNKIAYYDKPLIYYRLHNSQNTYTNLGIMDIVLIVYLSSDDYYWNYFLENKRLVCQKIFRSYKAFYKNVLLDITNIERCSILFDCRLIKLFKKDLYCFLLFIIVLTTYRNVDLVKFVLSRKLKNENR